MNIFNHKFFKGNLLTLFALVCCLILSSPLSANAAELPVSSSKASYDLAKGGTQTFTINNKNGELIFVTITKLQSKSRISNGVYKATFTKPNCWSAGFNVTITNNCFTSVGSKFYTVFSGSVINNHLSLESTKQASLYMTYRNNLIVYNTGVRAKISGTSLNVSEI